MKKVLFICTANVCRSPMAEAIFNALAQDGALGYRAESAGVASLKERSIAQNAIAVLEETGITVESHRARQVSEAMLKEADIVLAMGPRHVAELRRLFNNLPSKTYTLAEYATGLSDKEGISDPYGGTMTIYRACLRQLYVYIDRVVDLLRLESSDSELQ